MTPFQLLATLQMELALLRHVQALEAQISQMAAVVEPIPVTSTAQTLQIPTNPIQDNNFLIATGTVVNATPTCPLYNAYHQAQFCPNQPLPSFCPATSTRQEWNQGASNGGNWNYKSIYVMGKMPLSDDQLIQCDMLPR